MSRIKWIDLTRVIAIFFVILCHCFDSIYHIVDYRVVYSLSFSSKCFVFLGYGIGRLGVPLFLMISGYLLLDRKYDVSGTNLFWKKNCLPLFLCTIFWCIIYEIYLIFVLHQSQNLSSIIFELIFLKPMNISHIWYMPMIIGMYILIPFVANSLKEYDFKTIFKPLVIFLILSSGVPFLINTLGIYDFKDLSLQISLGFSGGIYGCYLILGYLTKKNYLKKINKTSLIFLFCSFSIITVIYQYWAFNNNYHYYLWYDFPLLVITSVILFELISRIKITKYYTIIKFLSKFSFSVFLIHILILKLISPKIIQIWGKTSFSIFLLGFIVIIISYIVSWIIYKIPKIGKYVLYIKT